MSTMRVNHYLRFKSKKKCAKEKIVTSNNMYIKVQCQQEKQYFDNNQFLKTSSLVPGYETGGKDD